MPASLWLRIAAVLFSGLGCTLAQAAEPRLQDATITGNGGTITISRLPVHTAHGTIYRDVTIQLSVDEAGNVQFATRAPGAPVTAPVRPALVQAPSLPPKPQHFSPGTYEGPDGSLMKLSRDETDGTVTWHFSTLHAGSGTLEGASWQEGAIQDNPHALIIRRARITALDYSYGVSEGGSGAFSDGALLGATQTGATLAIVSFRHGCCTNTPVASARWVFARTGR